MTDLIKKKANEILSSKELKKYESSSLLKKLKAKNSKRILLIDTSGSMSDHLPDGKTKFMVMVEILSQIDGERIFSFDSGCRDITNQSLNYPDGGTNLALAFHTIKAELPEEVILVTDGCPDDPQMAIMAATGLKNMAIVYIGPDPMPHFLKDLQEFTKGTLDIFNLNKDGSQHLLQKKILGLLGK